MSIRYQLPSNYYYNLSFVASFYKSLITMLEYKSAIERVERTKLATALDKAKLELVLVKGENALLQKQVEEKEKHRIILVQMVKRRTEVLSPPKANTEGAGQHADVVTNTNNANHRPVHPDALNYLRAKPEWVGNVNPTLPPQSLPTPTEPTDWKQQIRTLNEKREALDVRMRMVEREREQYMHNHKSFSSHNHKECTKQFSDGVQGGKVKKENRDKKCKRHSHKGKGRLDQEATKAFLKRLEFDLVIREKSDGKSE